MRQLCHFFRADTEYGQRVADALGVDVSEFTEHMQGAPVPAGA
jgi:catalase